MTTLFLGRICRTCLLESSTMHKLLDPCRRNDRQIEDMLLSTVMNFDLWPDEDTPLPVEICADCLERLQVSYDFQQMCLLSNERLKHLISQSKMKNEELLSGLDRNCSNTDDNLQEVFKIEVNEELMTVVSYVDDAKSVDPVKQESSCETSSCTQIDDGMVKEELNYIYNEEYNDYVDDTTQVDCEFGDIYSPSDGPDCILSPSEDKNDLASDVADKTLYPNNNNKRRKRKYLRRAPRVPISKTCTVCHKVFKKRMYLTRHMSVHSLENQFRCEICEYRYATAKLLTIHKSRRHCDVIINVEGGPYQCPDCHRIFDQTRALAAHRVMHLERDFNCEICGDLLKTLGAITRHMNSKHSGVLPYKCAVCDEAFPVVTHYEDHVKMHKGYKKYKCEMCDKSFPNTTALKDHIRTHTGESPYLCSHCGKAFKTTNVLRQHLKRHGEKTILCRKCPMRFFAQSNLQKHMLSHSKEKPHVCDICGSSFGRSDSLKTHKLKHSGERPFKCDQCNLSFVFKSYLMRHKVRHTGEKPHLCTYCDRAYASSGDLVKHLRTHVGENTYFCDTCPQTFRYQHDFRDHKNEHYNEKQKDIAGCDEMENDKNPHA